MTGQPAFYWDGGVLPFQAPPFINPGYGVGFTTTAPTGAVAMNYVPWASRRKATVLRGIFNFPVSHGSFNSNMTVSVTYAGSGGRCHYVLGNGLRRAYGPTPFRCKTWRSAPCWPPRPPRPTNIAAAQAIIPSVGLPFSNFQGTINQMLKPYPAILRS